MSNISIVKSIGAGERKLAVTADAIVGKDAGTLDKKAARTEATERVWTFVGGKEGAPAQSDKSGKKKTDFGRGFGSLVSAVASRLSVKDDTNWLRLVEQAATNAVKNKCSVEDVLLAAKRGAEAGLPTETE